MLVVDGENPIVLMGDEIKGIERILSFTPFLVGLWGGFEG
jgi:hypothetical protein